MEKLKIYTENTLKYDDKEISKNNRFTVQYPSLISFCKTYNIFPNYMENMSNDLKDFQDNNEFEVFGNIEKRVNYLKNT